MRDGAPTIETPNLRLRAFEEVDGAARAAILADPEVYRFIAGRPSEPGEGLAGVQRYAGMWALGAYGPFAIARRDGRLIGEAGLGRFGRQLGQDYDQAPEAAWLIARAEWGQGFAHEAMTAVLDWAERAIGRQRVVCLIADGNVRSLGLAGRLGFVPFRAAVFRDRPVTLFERLPSGHKAG